MWKLANGKNQCLVCSVGIFKAFDVKVETFVGSRL